MRSVVIGGHGFLGGAVVRDLIERGDDVVIVDNRDPDAGWDDEGLTGVADIRADIRDQAGMETALRGADEIYHFAGLLGTSELESDLRNAVHTNVLGSLNVFEAAIKTGTERVFLACKPNVWLNAYSISKNAAEQFAQIHHRDTDLKVRCLRYFNAYGERQHLMPVRKIVPAFAAFAVTGQPIEIFGDGEQTVDLIFAPDLANITVDYTRADEAGPEAVECGRGAAITVNQVAEAVVDYFNLPADRIVRGPMRIGETEGTELVADIAGLEAVLGTLKFTSLEDSLASTLAWYARRPIEQLQAAVDFYRAGFPGAA